MIHHSGRQAISTKFLGPTNCHGARIKATAQAGSVTVPYDHSQSTTGAHDKAAQALIDKFGWGGDWLSGGSADERGYTYLPLPVVS